MLNKSDCTAAVRVLLAGLAIGLASSAGPAAAANDSVITVDDLEALVFPDALVGAEVGPLTRIIQKTGTSPTNASTLAIGDASVGSPILSFGPGASSVSLEVGLDTSTAGLKVGAVIIDNLAADSAGAGLGSADPMEVLSTVGLVFAAADVSGNTAAALGDGQTVSIANNLNASRQSTAYVDSYTMSNTAWSIDGLANSVLAGETSQTARVHLDKQGLLGGQTVTGTLTIHFENNQALAGAADRDAGSVSWQLAESVTANVGGGTAQVQAGGSYAGLSSRHSQGGATATILAGDNHTGGQTTVSMTWRRADQRQVSIDFGDHPHGSDPFLEAVTEANHIGGSIVTVEGVQGSFALRLGGLPATISVRVMELVDGVWTNAFANNAVGYAGPFVDFNGTYAQAVAANGGEPLPVGAWGSLAGASDPWVVIDHDGTYGVALPVPSTAALLLPLLAIGVGRRRMRRGG